MDAITEVTESSEQLKNYKDKAAKLAKDAYSRLSDPLENTMSRLRESVRRHPVQYTVGAFALAIAGAMILRSRRGAVS